MASIDHRDADQFDLQHNDDHHQDCRLTRRSLWSIVTVIIVTMVTMINMTAIIFMTTIIMMTIIIMMTDIIMMTIVTMTAIFIMMTNPGCTRGMQKCASAS